MFVGNLNIDQQGFLLFLAENIIEADGKVVEDEKKMLNVLRSQCYPNVTPVECSDLSQLNSVFDTQKSKSSLMLELIALAYADEEIHELESAKIAEVASNLMVPDVLVDDMVSWVKRQFSLMREATTFMEN